MKLLAVLSTLLLSACISVPVAPKFPELPKELDVKCADLRTIEGTVTTLSKLMDTVAVNYNAYHVCAVNNEALREWIKKQTEIFNSVAE
jgi:hypothetical protein